MISCKQHLSFVYFLSIHIIITITKYRKYSPLYNTEGLGSSLVTLPSSGIKGQDLNQRKSSENVTRGNALKKLFRDRATNIPL